MVLKSKEICISVFKINFETFWFIFFDNCPLIVLYIVLSTYTHWSIFYYIYYLPIMHGLYILLIIGITLFLNLKYTSMSVVIKKKKKLFFLSLVCRLLLFENFMVLNNYFVGFCNDELISDPRRQIVSPRKQLVYNLDSPHW